MEPVLNGSGSQFPSGWLRERPMVSQETGNELLACDSAHES